MRMLSLDANSGNIKVSEERKNNIMNQDHLKQNTLSENIVLCGASSYEQKYFFNEQFRMLPEEVKKELQILCVLFTEDVGGVLTLEFEADGTLEFKVQVDDGDYLFDEIGSELKIRRYQKEKRELLESLELYYRVVFMGEQVEDLDEA